MCEYLVTIEFMLNENVNIKRLDSKIELLLNENNGKLLKTDILYNTNKRYKLLPKDIMFNNYIISFNKFIETKKFIINLLKNLNYFEKKAIHKLSNITRYCSKKKVDDKEIYNKFENNIIISNIDKAYTKYNKKKTDNLFNIKKDNNTNINSNKNNQLSVNDINSQLKVEKILNLDNLDFNCDKDNSDKYLLLKKYITDYYMKNNIIN